MTKTELNKYKALLEAKRAELAGGLRNREGIAIEKTADALDEVQLAGERELAIRNLDRESNLLAFGAILRHDLTIASESEIVEGSRTTAAVESSKFGSVLKISEDGLVSFYRNRICVWEL